MGGPVASFPPGKSKAIADDKSVPRRSTRGRHDVSPFQTTRRLVNTLAKLRIPDFRDFRKDDYSTDVYNSHNVT